MSRSCTLIGLLPSWFVMASETWGERKTNEGSWGGGKKGGKNIFRALPMLRLLLQTKMATVQANHGKIEDCKQSSLILNFFFEF